MGPGWGGFRPWVERRLATPRSVASRVLHVHADGAGVEELWTRKTWLLHPLGFQHTGTPSKASFSLTELKAAAQWDRVVERKNVPFAALVTNG